MDKDKYEEIKRKMNPAVVDALGDAEKFIMTYFGNGDSEEEIAAWAGSKGYSPSDERGLSAIDQLLASPENDKELIRLVVWVANHPLTYPDGEHARAWLKEKREWLGEILGY
jgi:hypothetical protein